MVNYSERAVRARIIVSGILLPVIVICPMIIAFYLYAQKSAIQSQLDKAKAVCRTAKSIDSEQGCEFVPVATASEGFDLSFADRRMFDQKYLSGDSVKDFYLVDDSKNLLCYTAFVRARKTCLDCHGDPRKSKNLWVQNDNPKSMPAHLSGFKEGDIFGAYEVIAPLSKGGKQGADATLVAGVMLIAGISIYSISFFAVISYVLNQHGGRQENAAGSDWDIYDLGQRRKDEHPISNTEYPMMK